MKFLFVSICTLLLVIEGFGQTPSFVSPVNIPLVLNGNFGEIRSNHFHAGIDIKTNGMTGLPVFSIADGVISRISVSATGYGKTLYIDHPSGYTSVYAHLDRFIPEIEKWVKEQQYLLQRFEVNLEPSPTLFRFSKGEQIAFSGNTGSSAGPHLHFEIRKTESQHPVNPLLLGFNIIDTSKPVVTGLFIYPLDDNSHVKSGNKKQKFALTLQNGVYRIKDLNEAIPVWGNIGFGIEATDYLDASWSKCGIFKLEIRVDSLLVNSFTIDELAYEKMRAMNSHIDYEEFVSTKRRIQKTYIEPGNRLDIYSNSVNSGIVNLSDGAKHRINISVFDVAMNRSEIVFWVQCTKPVVFPEKKYAAFFKFDRKNKFETDDVELVIPEEALYTDVKFTYKRLPKTVGIYSDLHQLHDNNVPLHNYAEVKIKASHLPEHLRHKAIICLTDAQGTPKTSLGGEYSFGWIKTETRNLGTMCIAVDTIAPRIKPLSFSEQNTLTEKNRIRFKITDNLSGIKTYNGFIDGSWVLFEYDAKSNTITYHFDEKIAPGKKHQLKLVIEDAKANKREYTASF